MLSEQHDDTKIQAWKPRIRLRDLKGVHVCLDGLGPGRQGAGFCYIAIWSLLKLARKQDEAHCLAISHQVPLDSSITWVPVDFEPNVEADLLHSTASGAIHLHVYYCREYYQEGLKDARHASQHSLQRHAKPPAVSPLHEVESDSNEGTSDNEDTKTLAVRESKQREDSAHLVGFQQRFAASAEPLASVPLQLCSQSAILEEPVIPSQMGDAQLCSSAQLPGQLMLGLSLDISALPAKQHVSSLPDKQTTLLFEFANGRQTAWPPEEVIKQDAIRQDSGQHLSNALEAIGGFGGAWRSLFRRGNQASAVEAPASQQHSSSASLLTPSLQDGGLVRDGNIIGAHSPQQHSLLGTNKGAEVSVHQMEESNQLISRLQGRKDLVRAQTAMAEHQLQEAIKMRKKKHTQGQTLSGLRTRLQTARQREIRARRQLVAVQSSCKTARQLMQTHTDHLTIACANLEDVWHHVEGPANALQLALHTDWSLLHRHLVARRCRLVADLQSIFCIQPRTVPVLEMPQTGFLWHRLEHGWSEVPIAAQVSASEAVKQASQAQVPSKASETSPSTTDSMDAESIMSSGFSDVSLNTSQLRSVARLAIGSLHLETSMTRQRSEGLVTVAWQSEQEQDEEATAALGYTVHVVYHLAAYLGVQLKYPVRPANSKSSVLSQQEGIRSKGSESESSVDAASQLDKKPVEYALHSERVAPARFTHGLHLLNKDVEQLLSMHGLSVSGTGQLLQNLHKLLTAASSAI